MNEVLYDKIKYLLEFKNISDEQTKYNKLLEKVFYQFMMALTCCCHSIEFIICFNSRPFYLPLIYTSYFMLLIPAAYSKS